VKKKVPLIALAMGLLMLFAAAAPVMAYDPKPGFSFNLGEVIVPNPIALPPTVIPTASGEFVLGYHAIDYGYASILSYQVFNEEDWFYQNLKTYTGYGADVITSPSSEEHDVYTINGPSLWTYTGPNFTYKGPTYNEWISGAKITTGEEFPGILITGTGSIHFTSGPLAGETAVDTFAGVIFPDSSGIFVTTFYVP